MLHTVLTSSSSSSDAAPVTAAPLFIFLLSPRVTSEGLWCPEARVRQYAVTVNAGILETVGVPYSDKGFASRAATHKPLQPHRHVAVVFEVDAVDSTIGAL